MGEHTREAPSNLTVGMVSRMIASPFTEFSSPYCDVGSFLG